MILFVLNNFQRNFSDILLLLALLRSVQAATGAPSISSLDLNNRAQELGHFAATPLNHVSTEPVSYRSKYIIANRHTVPAGEAALKFFEWQVIQSSSGAVACNLAVYL